MSSISYGRSTCIGTGAGRIRPEGKVSYARQALKVLAVALMGATLAGCAKSSLVSHQAVLHARTPQPEPDRQASFVPRRQVAAVTKRYRPRATSRAAARTNTGSYGIASFYRYDSKTASGEKFNPNDLTAAHRTLPFGTRLRVTNVATGKSVTVRVNDRGPFIPGRVVDVSYSAAESLGIVERGVAKVKLDVVQ
jgi:rare lipoprotein A